MAVLTATEILEKVKARVGDDTSDETLQFIEDVSDTVTDLENKSKNSTDWEKKYKENDQAWREKYKQRFFSTENNDESDEDEPDTDKPLTFENLFKEETK